DSERGRIGRVELTGGPVQMVSEFSFNKERPEAKANNVRTFVQMRENGSLDPKATGRKICGNSGRTQRVSLRVIGRNRSGSVIFELVTILQRGGCCLDWD